MQPFLSLGGSEGRQTITSLSAIGPGVAMLKNAETVCSRQDDAQPIDTLIPPVFFLPSFLFHPFVFNPCFSWKSVRRLSSLGSDVLHHIANMDQAFLVHMMQYSICSL
jgi:hypothetical protein